MRERITPGTVGTVAVVPLGITSGGTERVIPAPCTDAGETLPYPKTWRVGGTYKVAADDGLAAWTLTRWRGLARVIDVDGTEYMVRRWRSTKAAEHATERAGLDRLAELQSSRDRAREVDIRARGGDVTTTVGDLLSLVMDTPAVAKLAHRTRQDYRYTLDHLLAHDQGAMAAMAPRNVDVAAVRAFMSSFTAVHGSSGARAKALLRRAFDLATESAATRVPFNPVSAARDAIPAARVRERKLDTHRVPTDDEVTVFLAALQVDPAVGPMIGPRNESRNGHAGSVVNGTDVADLLAFTFTTGARVGEASALRWADLTLVTGAGTAAISGTVIWIKGQGTVRQPRTKTKGSARDVPLSDDLVALLLRRAETFGVDLNNPEHLTRPVSPSPQAHDRFRDSRNLTKAIRAAMDRHGLAWASSHTARRWRVTSLLDRGVPLGKVADAVGHVAVRTTLGYIGRGRGTDDEVRAAL